MRFWGNENASVSTVLLYSIADALKIEIKPEDLLSAATFYPYYNSQYKSPNTKESKYVFEHKGLEGWLLFGSYQFGGHKYFKEQNDFYPEDCSSAVGKATDVYLDNLAGICTANIINAFDEQNNIYGYQPVTTNKNQDVEINKIQNGDIFVKRGHTAIVSGIDNHGNFETYEFNRDLGVVKEGMESELKMELKMEGGGKLCYKINDFKSDDIFFLRKDCADLGESTNIKDILESIDKKLTEMHSNPDLMEDLQT